MAGLPEGLAEAIAAISGTPTLLVALDFDGTLAPTVDDPDAARALPAARQAVLGLLALPATRVALVSGRALASLERVSRLPSEVLLVGSHGAEFRLDGQETGPHLDRSERERLDTLYEGLVDISRRYDGVHIEQKPAGIALHTRLASRADAGRSETEALAVASGVSVRRWSVRRGKDVLEFAVLPADKVPADKGAALRRLREFSAASGILFAGDDVTDEDAFAALGDGDVGVKVGGGGTSAAFRVGTPAEVVPVLELLAERRRRAGFSPR